MFSSTLKPLRIPFFLSHVVYNVNLCTDAAVFPCPQIKELPQFNNQEKFEPMVGGQKMEMDSILVYYVDAKAPTFTMKHLTGGVIAVIVVVILAVVAGLLVLVSVCEPVPINFTQQLVCGNASLIINMIYSKK